MCVFMCSWCGVVIFGTYPLSFLFSSSLFFFFFFFFFFVGPEQLECFKGQRES